MVVTHCNECKICLATVAYRGVFVTLTTPLFVDDCASPSQTDGGQPASVLNARDWFRYCNNVQKSRETMYVGVKILEVLAFRRFTK